MGRIRSRFLRAVVETVHQETAGTALPRLREGLQPHLRGLLQREVLGTIERDATVELVPALDLLLAIDRVLCGGSGVTTTRVASALASRVLSQSAGLVVPGDAVATLSHLRAPFEQPFVETAIDFQARRSADGFVLELSMGTELRAARWLAAAGLGYAKAAARFSGESATRLRLFSEVTGDVARVLGRQMDSGVVNVRSSLPAPPTRERQPAPRRRPTPTNAAARVDQILSRATPSHGTPAPEHEPRGVARASSRPPPGPLAKSQPAESLSIAARSASARPRKLGAS